MKTVKDQVEASVWASRWLWAAGIYNLLWGGMTVAFPDLLFDLTGIARVNYPEIWQCVGMIVGVYGIGYYVKESRISGPPEVVFAFHDSAGALQRLIPPWEKMEVVESSGSLLPGSLVILRGRLLGFLPVRWVAEHTEYDPPRLFADRQVSGPFAYWYHRHHTLDDRQGGTILRDEVECRPPLGALGRWLGGWLVRRKLQRMFNYRHEVTRQMIESGEWKPEPQGATARGDQ